MSFVMLTESQIAEPSNAPFKQAPSSSQTPSSSSPPQAIPYNTERLNRIYEILSSRSDIDHPICVECTELVLSGLQTRLDNAVRERDSYVSFLKQVNSNVPTAKQLATAQTELQTAHAAEKKAFASLCSVEEEKEAIETEIAALEAEAEQLDEEERAFWRQHNAFSEKLSDFQNARDAVNIRYDRDTALLARLQRTNVITDAFAIGYDGKYATINGLRLGRSTVQPVEWAEINAAYGYTVLLLSVLAEKVGFQFQGFRLHPLGSTSKIEELPAAGPNGTKPPPIMHELFTTSDVLPLSLELFSRSFDAAQAAFLTCVGQLLAHVQADPAMAELAAKRQRLKYGIRKDRIGSEEPGVGMLSIRLGIGSGRNEEWTRACKFLLTVCKYLLAVVGLREESQPGSGFLWIRGRRVRGVTFRGEARGRRWGERGRVGRGGGGWKRFVLHGMNIRLLSMVCMRVCIFRRTLNGVNHSFPPLLCVKCRNHLFLDSRNLSLLCFCFFSPSCM